MSRSADSDPLLGRVLDGKYTLQSVLGRGGMGVVYKAHQSTLERPVALKLLRGFAGEEGADEREQEFQRRFFLEAATAAKLKHPNTITVFDYGSATLDGERVYWITMELLEGETLSKVLSKEAPLPAARALHIGLQICRSLRRSRPAIGFCTSGPGCDLRYFPVLPRARRRSMLVARWSSSVARSAACTPSVRVVASCNVPRSVAIVSAGRRAMRSSGRVFSKK